MQGARQAVSFARAWAILTRPGRAWDEIAREPAEPGRLFAHYVAPLAAIPAVCGVIGPQVFAYDIAQVRLQADLLGLVLENAAGFVLTLALVWLLAQAIAALSPAFGGVRSRAQALKLAAYAFTALWLAGVFQLYPSLAIPAATLAGLYALYTLYLGLPKLMAAPEDRKLYFFASVLLVFLALVWARGFLAGKAAELGGPLSLA